MFTYLWDDVNENLVKSVGLNLFSLLRSSSSSSVDASSFVCVCVCWDFWDYVTDIFVLLLACCIFVCLVGLFLAALFYWPFFCFSAVFCFTIIGRSSLEFCSFLSGVACHAAFWIVLVMFSTASSISILVFRGISKVISSSRVSPQQLQSVLFAV